MTKNFISKPFAITVVAAAVASGVGGYVWHEQHRPRILELYVIGLRSGYSIFIRTPEDRRILIDGGPNSEIIRTLTRILPFYSRRIDTLIAAHTDSKNMSGFIDIIERYSVANVFVPSVTLDSIGLASSTDLAYDIFLNMVRRQSISLKNVSAGDEITLEQAIPSNSSGSVSADILFPAHPDQFVYSKSSAPSLVIRISYGTTSFLILNSITPKIQKYIASQDIPRSDVLVVSHNASADNLAEELMQKVHPRFLIYLKSIVGFSKQSSVSKSDDPLFFLAGNKRFNVRERGVIRVTSDGLTVDIK